MATQSQWQTIQDLVSTGQNVSDALDVAFKAVDDNATELTAVAAKTNHYGYFGNLREGVLPSTLAANVPSDVTMYAYGDSDSMAIDLSAGTISIPLSGRYRITLTGTLTYDKIGYEEQEVTVKVDSSDGLDPHSINICLAISSKLVQTNMSTSIVLVGGKDYKISFESLDSTLVNVSSRIEFDITPVNISV